MRRTGRRVLIPLLLATAAALTLAPARPVPPASASLPPIDWGLYYLYWRGDYHEKLRQVTGAFARPPEYVMFFIDLGRPFPQARVDAIHALGAVPQLSLELITWHGHRNRGSYLPDIEAGAYDAFFRDWAEGARRDGRRVQLRFGYEFNGDWFSWSHDPEAFRRCWRRVHGIFEEVGADNVEWVWSPNVVSCPDTPGNSMHRYYPGDAFVDWIGIDGYNFGDHHDEWHQWESAESVFRKTLEDLLRTYRRPRFLISEFGCPPGRPGARAAWIRAAYTFLRRYPRVEAAIWYHQDKRREGEPNWKLVEDDGSLDAFNATFSRLVEKVKE